MDGLHLGFAALVTGLLSLASELFKERHDTHIQACAVAEQIVADDALDGDLDAGARKRLVTEAARQIGRCWER